ncbi:MAG TPA: glycosyltransferase family 2 protein [Verrucomicrobiae bacterium]
MIPCLNEAPTIGLLVEEVRQYVEMVFVIDDGSSDRTAERAAGAGARVIPHVQNQGKGAALQSGWKAAREGGFQWVLTLDGDGQHSPADIPAFFDCAARTSAALVVGNRMNAPHKMPRLRRLVNRWMSRRLSGLAGQTLPDSQCGFRLLNLAVLGSLPITSQRFEVESEVLLAFARGGHRIEFVPIQSLYKSEQSKIHPVRDALRWLRWWRKATR